MKAKVDLTEFISGFLAEADELIALANRSLLSAETASKAGHPNPRAVREAFRALHTIKGLAAMVGVEPIVAVAHRLEASLRVADQGATRLLTPAIDLLLKGLRTIEQQVHALRVGQPVPEAPTGLLAHLDALEASPPQDEGGRTVLALAPEVLAKLAAADREQLVLGLKQGQRAFRLDFTPTPTRAAEGVTITSVRAQLKDAAEIVKVLPIAVAASDTAPGGLTFALFVLTTRTVEEIAALSPAAGLVISAVLVDPLASSAAPEPVRSAPPPLPELFFSEPDVESTSGAGLVRVEVRRLDETIERLSALVVTRFRLAHAVQELAASGVDVRKLNQIMAENGRQLRDLRAAVLHVRMVRVADVLERVPLLVRGLRQNTGKQVRLELDTGSAEVDKAVAERLFPAIVHLVRNAVDHAIESPEERRALGKPEEGLLRISCQQRSNNQLELIIEDDGRGVDREKVAGKAGREVPATDAALLEMLCLPGLSTRAEATTTSGRGMGMDIVRRIAVKDLGGELLLRTTPGKGSRFTLHVPLTITIVDAFSLECAGQRFVVPVSVVEEIIEFDPAAVTHGPGGSSAGMVQRRGAALPLLQLANVFGLSAAAPATKALIFRRAGEATGLAVHRMIGQQEVVMRPLEDPLVRVSGVTGATDLGDGRPTLVLDLPAIAGSALRRGVAA